jgi:O-antigen/teichoic acid export membrane protein
MNDIRKPILFSAFERYSSFLLLVVSMAVLARLLSPEEFGVYVIASALTSVVATSFQELGGANYLIQKTALSERNIRTAFTLTLIISILVAAVLFGCRDAAARFFSQEGLRIGISMCALNLLFSPALIIITALLRREMDFSALARCNLAANFVASVGTIALAARGYSYMAPLVGMLVGSVALTVLLLMHYRNPRIFLPCVEGYREVLEFGAYSGSVVIINIFYQFSPQLILGRVLDFSAVGLYSRAVSITQIYDRLVLSVLSPVIMPAILAHTRAGKDLKGIYLNAIELISVLQWPSLLFLAIMADTIIVLWLGPTWIELVPLVRVLCIASLSLFAACLTYPVLVAVGRVQDALISSLISLPPSLLMIFISSFFGVQAVASSALVTLPLQALVAIYFIGRRLSFRPSDLLRATVKSVIVTATCAASILLSLTILKYSGGGPVAELFLAGTFALVGWWFGLLLASHPLLAKLRAAASGILVAARASVRQA